MVRHDDIGADDAAVVVDAVREEVATRVAGGVAIAVVDTHGELVAFLRTDGCPLPSIVNAINKAFTAAREGVPSAEVGRRSRDQGFPMSNYGDPRYTTWGGGVPITRGGRVIGAVGVSGLPEAEDMELAARGAAEIS
jgi:glc operon protein GlcG